jgi:hypothetical protein
MFSANIGGFNMSNVACMFDGATVTEAMVEHLLLVASGMVNRGARMGIFKDKKLEIEGFLRTRLAKVEHERFPGIIFAGELDSADGRSKIALIIPEEVLHGPVTPEIFLESAAPFTKRFLN